MTAEGALLDSVLLERELVEDSPLPEDEALADSSLLEVEELEDSPLPELVDTPLPEPLVCVAGVLLFLPAAESAGSCPEASCT